MLPQPMEKNVGMGYSATNFDATKNTQPYCIAKADPTALTQFYSFRWNFQWLQTDISL
jgi:hypothetical protein